MRSCDKQVGGRAGIRKGTADVAGPETLRMSFCRILGGKKDLTS